MTFLKIFLHARALRQIIIPVFLVLVVSCGLLSAVYDNFYLLSITNEEGFIELATVYMFGVAATLGFLVFIKTYNENTLYFSLLMGMAMARELDWHKALTQDSIFKTNFYLKQSPPLIEIIGGLAVILLLLIIVSRLSFKTLPKLKTLYYKETNLLLLVFAAGGFLVFGKVLDSFKRLVPSMKGFYTEHSGYFTILEECSELAGSFVFVLFGCFLLKKALPASSTIIKPEVLNEDLPPICQA